MPDQVTLMIGTTKGAFLLTSDAARMRWKMTGPHCDGWPINHMASNGTSIWAAGGGEWHGSGVWRSDDSGQSWALSKLANGQMDAMLRDNPEMAAYMNAEADPPAPFTGDIDAIWSLDFAHGRLLAGAKPASLYASDDRGESWRKMTSLTDDPSAETWTPGGAGLTLHTIVTDPGDPGKLWTAMSVAGVYASEDGGETWERRNRLDNAAGAHVHADGGTCGETGHCVHNMVRARLPTGTDILYQQNHEGTFRSADGGRSWHDITPGLPSTFGFPIEVHPHDPDMIWVLPLNGDTLGRYPPNASAAVWKSTDGGTTWAAKQSGLPVENCYFTVLRQAMTTDTAKQTGVYFGTNSGSIFASMDEGENWQVIAAHLPTVLCVQSLS